MLRALLWKEWRTQRPLLGAAVAITVLLPLLLLSAKAAGSSRSGSELTLLAAFVMTICVWPVFAALTGAMIFGQETSDGSLRFLLSRPVSRARLWFVKIASVLAFYAALLVATGAIACGFYLAGGGTLPDLSRASNYERTVAAAALVGACIFLLLCAAFCSLFVHRPLTAALGGTVIAGGVVALVSAAWQPFLAGSEYARMVGFAAGTPIALIIGIFGVAAATFREFGGGDAIRTVSVKAAVKPLALVVLSIVTIGAGPVAYASLASLATADARVSDHLAIVDGGIVTTEVADNGLTTRIVRIDGLTRERQVLVAGHATLPSVSPDGHWIAYAHFDGYRGELAREFSVRVVRTDGTDDRPVLEGARFAMPEPWAREQPELSIDPRSELVAISLPSGRVLIGALAGGAGRWQDTGAATGFVGWIADGPKEFLTYDVARVVGGRPRIRLIAANAETGARRTLAEFPAGPLRVAKAILEEEHRPRNGWRWFPMSAVASGASVGLRLVELGAGPATRDRFPDAYERPSPCASPPATAVALAASKGWFTPEGSRFVYAHDCLPRNGRYAIELRVRDLEAGSDELFARLPGMRDVDRPYASPDGDRFVLSGRSAAHGMSSIAPGVLGWGTIVVEAGETPRWLATGLIPVGWLDEAHVVARNFGGPMRRLFVIDVDSGARHEITLPGP